MAADANLATKDDLSALHTSLSTDMRVMRDELSADIRALGVRFESLESFMRGIAEGLTSTREQLEHKIDSLEERLGARIDLLEEVARQSSNDIQALKVEVADLRRQLVRREKLDELDGRITALEKRVGIKS